MVYEYYNFNGVEISIDQYLRKKLDILIVRQKRDFDCCFIIDGKEGSGKSALGLVCGWYLSKGKITPKNIAENSDDAIKKLDLLEDKSVLIIDEGSLSFSSRETMSREQRRLTKILNVIRQKRLILIIIAPSFFDLSKYISVDRSLFLLHVYVKFDYQRGRFAYFSQKQLRYLYEEGKKNYHSYQKPRAKFISRFPDFQPPWYDEYIKIKKKTLMSALKDNKPIISSEEAKRITMQNVIQFKTNVPVVTNTLLAQGFGVSTRTINRYLKRQSEETLTEQG